MVFLFPKLWSDILTVSAGNGTGADDDNTDASRLFQETSKGRAKANTKTRKEIARTTLATRAIQTSTRATTVAELGIGRKTARDQVDRAYDNSTSNDSYTQNAKNHKKRQRQRQTRRTLWKRISHLKQPQPCRILHKHQVRSELSRATPNLEQKGWVMGVAQSIPCLPLGDRLAQSICFLTVVHSFTHVRSSFQDKRYRCLILESTH